MAEIDKLIGVMVQRQAERAVLVSNQPSRIVVGGKEVAGAALNSTRLEAVLREITPPNLQSQLAQDSHAKFIYTSPQGDFQVSYVRNGDALRVIIMPPPAQGGRPTTLDAADSPPVVPPVQIGEPTLLTTLNERDKHVYSIVFSPDGNLVATGLMDAQVNIWNLQSGKVEKTINHGGLLGAALKNLKASETKVQTVRPYNSITALAFSSDGRTLATQSRKKLNLWDMPGGDHIKTLKRFYNSNNYSLAFAPDGSLLASTDVDGVVCLRNNTTFQEQKVLSHQYMMFGAPISLMTLFMGVLTQLVNLYLGQTPIAFSPDSKSIASGYYREVRVWDTQTGALKRSMEEGEVSMALSIFAMLIPYLRGRATTSVQGTNSRIVALAFSPDGKTLASGHRNNGESNLMLWDSGNGRQRPLKGHVESTNAVVFSSDGKILISGGNEGDIKFWDVASGELQRTVKAHTAAVNALTMSPDGRTLASCSDDKTIKLWLLR